MRMQTLVLQITYKVNTDGGDIAFGVSVVLQNDSAFSIRRLAYPQSAQQLPTHRKPQQQTRLAHTGITNKQQLQPRAQRQCKAIFGF